MWISGRTTGSTWPQLLPYLKCCEESAPIINDAASAVNYELFNWMSRDHNYFRILVVLWTKCILICTFAKVFSMKTIFCINSWKFSPSNFFHSIVYYDLAIITACRQRTEWVIAYGLKTILHTTKSCHTTPTVYSLIVSTILALMILYSHPPQTIIYLIVVG